MLNDPLSNALSNMLNHELIGRREVLLHPAGKILRRVLGIFNQQGYAGLFDEMTPARGGVIKLHLLGSINRCGVIKPRFTVKMETYEKFEKRYLPAKDIGILIVSTPQGIMTHEEAKAKNTGGRLLAYCY